MTLFVKHIHFTPVKLPLAKTLKLLKVLDNGSVVTKQFNSFIAWVCEVYTDDYYGQGYTYTIPLDEGVEIYQDLNNNYLFQLLHKGLDEAFDLLNQHKQHLINHSLRSSRFYHYFLSAIDIALWDIKLQSSNQSLASLFGVKEKEAPVYGSCGWLSYSIDELLADCQYFVNNNVFIYKIQIGGTQDEQRLKALRDCFGDRIEIAVDANQVLSYQQASAKLKLLEKYNIVFFEEPISGDSNSDLLNLAKQSSIPLASGENRLSLDSIINLCDSKLVKLIQPDIVRCGGISEIMQLKNLCDKNNLCLAMHLNHEYSVSVAPGFSNYLIEYAEFFPKNHGYFTFDLALNKNGCVAVPSQIGTGVRLSPFVLDSLVIKY